VQTRDVDRSRADRDELVDPGGEFVEVEWSAVVECRRFADDYDFGTSRDDDIPPGPANFDRPRRRESHADGLSSFPRTIEKATSAPHGAAITATWPGSSLNVNRLSAVTVHEDLELLRHTHRDDHVFVAAERRDDPLGHLSRRRHSSTHRQRRIIA
jgi:hypothetical protein